MKALVIGGGIAGPVTAMALQKAGIEATVYEAYGRSAGLEVGAFLTVAVNGLDALRTLDAHRPVLEAGFPTVTMSFRSGTGRRLGEMPIGGELADGTVTCTIRRTDLYRVLHEQAAARGIRTEHGKRLVAAEANADAGGVTARFDDGTEVSADLLIGADGIRSTVRSIIDPAAPAPRWTGVGNTGGFTRLPGVEAPPGSYEMIFGKRCFFGWTVDPDGEIWWFANPPAAHEPDRLHPVTAEATKVQLLELFAGDDTPAAAIVRATDEVIPLSGQWDMPSVPTWHRGPMVIVGDAAHATAPSSGQGASMAIEDAVVLARCLRDVDGIPAALAAFERRRRDRVERVVAAGARSSSQKAPGRFGRVARDLMMPLFLKRVAGKGNASLRWMYDHHIEWEERMPAA
jgi:2-polyprenyl-6-methoxyphenol hydroxylase-like FAD-dependent oxidoreductase